MNRSGKNKAKEATLRAASELEETAVEGEHQYHSTNFFMRRSVSNQYSGTFITV